MILELDEEQKQRIVVAHGYENDEATATADEFGAAGANGRERFARRRNAKVITLKSTNSLPATILISPADAEEVVTAARSSAAARRTWHGCLCSACAHLD